jgi:porin
VRWLATVLGILCAASATNALAQWDIPFAERSLFPDSGIRSRPDPAPAERYRPPPKPRSAGPSKRPPAKADPSDREAPLPQESGAASLASSRQENRQDEVTPPRTTSPLDVPPYSMPTSGEEGVPQSAQTLLGEGWHGKGGIKGEYLYTCDTFCLTHGGFNTNNAIRYIGSIDLVFNFDTEELVGWEGGRFFLFLENVHGQTLSPHFIGDFEFYDEYEPAPRIAPLSQVTEYWLEQKVGDRLTFKIGKQDANRDFIFPEYGVDYINSSFSLIPTILPPTYPNCGLGVAAFYQLSELVMLRAGVYDGSFFVGHSAGGQWGFDSLGRFGAMSLYEVQLRPQWGDGRLPGNYRAGGWHHTYNFPVSGGAPGQTVRGNHGYYLSFDQMLYRENPQDDEDTQGLGLFAQYGYAPYDRNTLEDYVGGGLAYRGPIAGRDEDICGVGVGQCFFSRSLTASAGQTTETSIELFYKAHVRHWLRVQPEMQFIASPGGNGRDALLCGLRVEVAL